MIYTRTPLTANVAAFWMLFSLGISICFGVFFWAVFRETSLVHHLAYSLINGLIVPQFAAISVLISNNAPPSRRIWIIYITCMTGAAVAVLLAFLLLGIPFSTDYLFMFSFTVNAAILSIIIGFLYYWERFADAKARIRQEQIRQLTTEKTIMQNQVALIQAQLEPEFVFDTLSRILELLDTDLEKAKAMQLALIQYLRLSLSGFESESTSIDKEMEIIRAYFKILDFFPENRFRCTIEIPDDMLKFAIPPMLVRSFVETIADHKKTGTGEQLHLHIRTNRQDGQLGFEFSGSGNFINSEKTTAGISRVRQRIEKLFGGAGRLILDTLPSDPETMTAAIYLPANGPSTGRVSP